MKTLGYIFLILLVTLISCKKKYTLDGSIDNPDFIGEWVRPRSILDKKYCINENGKVVSSFSYYNDHPSTPGTESKAKGRIQIEGHRMFMEFRHLIEENTLVELQIIQEPTNFDTTFTIRNNGERGRLYFIYGTSCRT